MTYGNGARAEYSYYTSGPLQAVSHFSAGGTLIASTTYEYDRAGNVTRVVPDDNLAANGDATMTYQYDALYRLTREQCAPAQGSSRFGFTYEYWYDAVGNRTKFRQTDLWTNNRVMVFEYSPRNELTRYSDPEGSGNYWLCQGRILTFLAFSCQLGIRSCVCNGGTYPKMT